MKNNAESFKLNIGLFDDFSATLQLNSGQNFGRLLQLLLFLSQLKKKIESYIMRKWHKSNPLSLQLYFVSFNMRFNPVPHSDIPKAHPSIRSVIGQSTNSEASEFLRHFWFDFAVSDFPYAAPFTI